MPTPARACGHTCPGGCHRRPLRSLGSNGIKTIRLNDGLCNRFHCNSLRKVFILSKFLGSSLLNYTTSRDFSQAIRHLFSNFNKMCPFFANFDIPIENFPPVFPQNFLSPTIPVRYGFRPRQFFFSALYWESIRFLPLFGIARAAFPCRNGSLHRKEFCPCPPMTSASSSTIK